VVSPTPADPPAPPASSLRVSGGSLIRTAVTIAWRNAQLRRIAAWTLLGWVCVYALAFGGTQQVIGTDHRFALVLGVATAVAAWPVAIVSTLGGVVLTLVADAALDGRRMTVREALNTLRPRRREIVLYALVVAVVSRLLATIQERVPLGGLILVLFVDVAWALATLLAIPVLALEGGAPRRVVTRSAKLTRARLGDALTGSFTLMVMIAPIMVAMVVLAGGVFSETAWVTAIGAGLLACCLWLTNLVATLFCLGLYRDEAGRAPSPAGFSQAQLAGGLRKRNSRWW
jgi:hypothetical protein